MMEAAKSNGRRLPAGISCKKEYKPLAIKRFLKSLTDFCSFTIDEEFIIPGLFSEDLLCMNVRASQWKKAFTGPAKAQEWKRMPREMQVLITPEQIAKHKSSEGAKNAVTLLRKLTGLYNELT